MASDYSWVGPAITAANNFAINAINKWSKLSKNEKYNATWYADQNYRYSQMAANADYARNLSMWRLNNQYNSPAAQMQRFKEAGLNPNLAYGQSNMASSPGMSHSSAPSVPVMNKDFGPIEGLGELGSRLVDILDPESTYNSTKEDAQQILRYHTAQAESAESQSAIDAFNAAKVEDEYIQHLEERSVQLTKQKAEIDDIVSRTNLTETQRDFYKKQSDKIDSDIKVNNARINNLNQNTELAEVNTAYTRKKGVVLDNQEVRDQEDHDFIQWKRWFDNRDAKEKELIFKKVEDWYFKTVHKNPTPEERESTRALIRQGGYFLYNLAKDVIDIVK